MKTSYVLVSPCKDEGQYIEKTLLSVSKQIIQPTQWIIVDDGSSDNSMEIVKKYQSTTMPYIKIISRAPQTGRNVGAGVIHAFNEGLPAIDIDYDFICKFDVDLDLPPKYFEILIQKMAEDPLLGTCSGKAYYIDSTGAMRSELCGDEASVGMTKFYRRECFEQIGGFVAEVGWDGYDCHLARWNGWRALSWDTPEDLRFIHLRPMGSSQKNIYRGRIRHGKGQFHQGTHPIFFLASSVFRSVKQKPYITGTFYAIYGYVKAAWNGEKHFGSAEITQFIRSYQMRALTHGKGPAAEWAFQKRRAELAQKAS
jgi:glycosyltransferase involved in cell wall biosynthesis